MQHTDIPCLLVAYGVMHAAVTEQRPDLMARESEANAVGGNSSAIDCGGAHALCSVGGASTRHQLAASRDQQQRQVKEHLVAQHEQ